MKEGCSLEAFQTYSKHITFTFKVDLYYTVYTNISDFERKQGALWRLFLVNFKYLNTFGWCHVVYQEVNFVTFGLVL